MDLCKVQKKDLPFGRRKILIRCDKLHAEIIFVYLFIIIIFYQRKPKQHLAQVSVSGLIHMDWMAEHYECVAIYKLAGQSL